MWRDTYLHLVLPEQFRGGQFRSAGVFSKRHQQTPIASTLLLGCVLCGATPGKSPAKKGIAGYLHELYDTFVRKLSMTGAGEIRTWQKAKRTSPKGAFQMSPARETASPVQPASESPTTYLLRPPLPVAWLNLINGVPQGGKDQNVRYGAVRPHGLGPNSIHAVYLLVPWSAGESS